MGTPITSLPPMTSDKLLAALREAGGPLASVAADEIERLSSELSAARSAALEKAAKVADDAAPPNDQTGEAALGQRMACGAIAAAIRELKDK